CARRGELAEIIWNPSEQAVSELAGPLEANVPGCHRTAAAVSVKEEPNRTNIAERHGPQCAGRVLYAVVGAAPALFMRHQRHAQMRQGVAKRAEYRPAQAVLSAAPWISAVTPRGEGPPAGRRWAPSSTGSAPCGPPPTAPPRGHRSRGCRAPRPRLRAASRP